MQVALADATKPLHASFKLGQDDDYVALLAPDGSVANAVRFPPGCVRQLYSCCPRSRAILTDVWAAWC